MKGIVVSGRLLHPAPTDRRRTRRRLTRAGRPGRGPARWRRRGIKCVIGALVKVPPRFVRDSEPRPRHWNLKSWSPALTQASTGRLQFSSSRCLFLTLPTPTPGPCSIPAAPLPLPPSPGDPSPAGRPLAGQQLFRPTTRPFRLSGFRRKQNSGPGQPLILALRTEDEFCAGKQNIGYWSSPSFLVDDVLQDIGR